MLLRFQRLKSLRYRPDCCSLLPAVAVLADIPEGMRTLSIPWMIDCTQERKEQREQLTIY
jgi:hypothetical protein